MTQCQTNKYKKIQFIIPGEVVGKGRPRFTVKGGFAKAYTPKKTKEQERFIKLCYLNALNYCSDRSLRVKIKIYMSIAKSCSKRLKIAKLEGRIHCRKKPDVDNVVKIILDALNGVAFVDDTQINQLAVIRTFGPEEKTIVTIEEIGEFE